MDFNVLEFIFAGAPPWTFPPLRICLFLSKLVKTSHFPSELQCSALEHAQVHTPSVPVCTDGSKSSEDVGCAAVFPDFDVFISLPVVTSIFTAELYAIFLALSRISFHDSDSFVIYSDPRSALQALGSLYTHNPMVLEIQRFLCDLHARRKFVSFCWIPSHVGLSGNGMADVLAKRSIQLPPANYNALPLQV